MPALPTVGRIEAQARATVPAPRTNGLPSTSLVDAVRPALVGIRVSPTGDRTRGAGRSGLGFVVDSSGYVVTTERLVQDAGAVEVRLPDGRVLPVTVVARDPLGEVAVLKVEARNLPAVTLGESGTLATGEPLVAVSRSAGGGAEIAAGRLSATGRATGGNLVTDVKLPADRAGAPLLNARGEAVAVATGGGSSGAGGIPIDRVKPILRDLKATGRGPVPDPRATSPR